MVELVLSHPELRKVLKAEVCGLLPNRFNLYVSQINGAKKNCT